MRAPWRVTSLARSRAALIAVLSVGALAATIVASGQGSAFADSPPVLTASGPDTVGFPYVDLVLGGVSGLGIGSPPPVTVTQGGQPVRTTQSWELSAEHPIAVVVDAPAASLAKAQGLVSELVQELPPEVPLSLASVGGRTGVNRDAFMGDLAKQNPGTPTSVASGVSTAAAAGVQHVFVVTTCDSAAPGGLPFGVMVDILGVGSACNDAWKSVGSAGAGSFTVASTFDTGLGVLDTMVARWRSSVVVVTQALNRQPLVFAVSGGRVTVPLTARAPVTPAASATGAPSATRPAAVTKPVTKPAISSSSSGRVPLLIGLLLLGFAAVLVVVWLLRRRRTSVEPVVAAPAAAEEAVVEEVVAPLPEPVAAQVVLEQPAMDLDGVQPGASAPRKFAPRLIDLRDFESTSPPVARDVRDGGPLLTQMAVASLPATSKAGPTQPAAVAEPDAAEEPVVVAEETPDEMHATEEQVQGEAVDGEIVDSAADAAESADADSAGVDTDAPEAEATEVVAAAEVAEEPAAEERIDAPAAEAPREQEVEDGPPAMPRSEFDWTPLSFAPLVWRYDAEPEAPQEIDLREKVDASSGGSVDLREDAGRKQPRRKRAKR